MRTRSAGMLAVAALIAFKLGDKPRLERLLDLFTNLSAAIVSSMIGALKVFRVENRPTEMPKKLLPPEDGNNSL